MRSFPVWGCLKGLSQEKHFDFWLNRKVENHVPCFWIHVCACGAWCTSKTMHKVHTRFVSRFFTVYIPFKVKFHTNLSFNHVVFRGIWITASALDRGTNVLLCPPVSISLIMVNEFNHFSFQTYGNMVKRCCRSLRERIQLSCDIAMERSFPIRYRMYKDRIFLPSKKLR